MLSDLYNSTKLATRGLSGPLQQPLDSHYTIHWNKKIDPLKHFSHHFGLQQVSHLTDGENEALGFMFNWGPLRVTTSSSAIKGLIRTSASRTNIWTKIQSLVLSKILPHWSDFSFRKTQFCSPSRNYHCHVLCPSPLYSDYTRFPNFYPKETLLQKSISFKP